MLIGNIRLNQKNPMKWLGGVGSPQCRSNFNYPGAQRNRIAFMPYAGVNNGYRPPYAWQMADHDGGLSSNFGIRGYAPVSASAAGGVNVDASMSGYSDLDGVGALVVMLLSSIQSTSGISASVAGVLWATAYFGATGYCTAALGALANAIGSIAAGGVISGSIAASAGIAADITPFTELSPESLSSAVWNTKAAAYAESGTMGKKLSDAGGGSSPGDIANAVWEHNGATADGSKGSVLDTTKKNTALIPGLF